jgi:hypothetical protein
MDLNPKLTPELVEGIRDYERNLPTSNRVLDTLVDGMGKTVDAYGVHPALGEAMFQLDVIEPLDVDTMTGILTMAIKRLSELRRGVPGVKP